MTAKNRWASRKWFNRLKFESDGLRQRWIDIKKGKYRIINNGALYRLQQKKLEKTLWKKGEYEWKNIYISHTEGLDGQYWTEKDILEVSTKDEIVKIKADLEKIRNKIFGEWEVINE